MSDYRIGRLLVIKRDYSHLSKNISKSRKKMAHWLCKCDCGKEIIVCGQELRNKDTQSCGCIASEIIIKRNIETAKHNLGENPIYHKWYNMMNRCYNPDYDFYHRYGGRGIKVCESWHDIKIFYNDMGDPPKKSEIDRIDNDGNYCKENCRWTTHKINCQNTSSVVNLTFNNQTKCISEWAKELNLKPSVISLRRKRGLSIEEILYKGKLLRWRNK